MSDLTKFSNEELGLVVSVPYRVGVWISNVDDNTGSKVDDRNERKALEATIEALAGKSKKLPFAAAIMREVEKNKAVWSSWDHATATDVILADVEKAIEICKAKTNAGAVKQYKQTIWKVGIVVAQAYGEHIDPDNEMHVDRFFQWVGSLGGGVKLGKNPENMSSKEKEALNKLRAILKN
jgi:hypothetical protein